MKSEIPCDSDRSETCPGDKPHSVRISTAVIGHLVRVLVFGGVYLSWLRDKGQLKMVGD